MKNQNYILIEEVYGVFLGEFINNVKHKHFAIQINIPLRDGLKVKWKDGELYSENAIVIPSNTPHSLASDLPFTLILINPLKFDIKANKIIELDRKLFENIKETSINFLNKNLGAKAFKKEIKNEMMILISNRTKRIDERIHKGLNYLKENQYKVLSLDEVAKFCHLSESRFLHLFKSETGITFRRAQLWYRISRSIKNLHKHNITETSHEFGFSDSAHYSRTFKENFGFSPKQFIKNSLFIQV